MASYRKSTDLIQVVDFIGLTQVCNQMTQCGLNM